MVYPSVEGSQVFVPLPANEKPQIEKAPSETEREVPETLKTLRAQTTQGATRLS